MHLPYLTNDFPGIGGAIKQRNEDFVVHEVPLYEPTGEGEHVYVEIQKTGLTTFEAISRIANALGVSSRDIGYAGLKDARAVTRQMLSIQGTTEEAVMGLKLDRIAIQWAQRHGNKLRLGHLAGNRFGIKIRNVNPTDVVKLEAPLKVLQERGMPNFFGEQRFGRRGNNHLIGAALIRNDNPTILQLLLGDPKEGDESHEFKARTFFANRQNDEAMHAYPRRMGLERRILARLMKTHKPNAAVRAIDQKLRRLWISALQSAMFNQVLAKRIETFDQLQTGDWAYKHENGACFKVEDGPAEQSRAAAWEISPTGPLLGYRMSMPEGEPGAIEQAAFDEFGLKAGDFRNEGIDRIKGARRPLRVQPKDVDLSAGVDEHGPYISAGFTLPAGSFATVLVGELMKTTLADEVGDQAEAEAESEPENPLNS